MSAYYNEIDPFASAWLKELIKSGLIANGDVDTRSIKEVSADDVAEYTQCHFFAGIGVWSYALRRAGWPDSRPVWTGSCPCQPFSAAGKGKGKEDERHLWPEFYRLIRECKPSVIFGEQVAAAVGHSWLDLVQSNLESQNYSVGKAVIGACSVGAPHIRQRLYFVANANQEQCGWRSNSQLLLHGQEAEWDKGHCEPEPDREVGIFLGDTERKGLEGYSGDGSESGQPERLTTEQIRSTTATGITGGFWETADWLYCRDGKYRCVEPGTFPLAHGSPARVGRLRGYGNAICSEVAKEFIGSFLEVEKEREQCTKQS